LNSKFKTQNLKLISYLIIHPSSLSFGECWKDYIHCKWRGRRFESDRSAQNFMLNVAQKGRARKIRLFDFVADLIFYNCRQMKVRIFPLLNLPRKRSLTGRTGNYKFWYDFFGEKLWDI